MLLLCSFQKLKKKIKALNAILNANALTKLFYLVTHMNDLIQH